MQLVSSSTKNHKAGEKKSGRRYIYLTITLAFFLFLISAGVTALSVKDHLEKAQKSLLSAADSAKSLNVSTESSLVQVETSLRDALTNFRSAKNELGPYGWILEQLGWVFYDGSRLNAFLDMAIPGLEGGLGSVELAQTLWQEYSSSSSSSLLIRVEKLLKKSGEPQFQEKLAEIEGSLARMNNARSTIDSSKLSITKLKEIFDTYDKYWPVVSSVLTSARSLPRLLPPALGSANPRKYLLIAQNSDELRPTGGFISAVGLVEADGIRLKILDFKDSYQVGNEPYVVPPSPLSQYMQAGALTLRDANWWPDFPQSAYTIAAFYTQNTGVKLDGVVSIDMQAVSYLFEALGPLSLPTYKETLTAQNFQERIRYYYLLPGQPTTGDWWLKRKDFLGDLFRGLMGKIEGGGDTKTQIKLLENLAKGVREKHLAFYPFEAELAAYLGRYRLDGGLGSGWQGDYLMVVDANTGFNKINPLIKEEISYQVEAKGSNGLRKATLTLKYTNTAHAREGDPPSGCKLEARYGTSYESMMAGCYWDYLRLYVPSGSQLLTATGFTSNDGRVDSYSEAGKTVFGGHFTLEHGKSILLSLSYQLPEQVEVNGKYQLLVQKQPGTMAIPCKVEVTGGPHWQGTLLTDWTSE